MKKILIIIALLFTVNVNSAEFPENACVGKVTHVGLYADGKLSVSNGYGVHYLCNVNNEFNGVSPDVCKSWYSIALAAHASNKDLAQFYPFSSGQSCASLGNWSTPTPMPYFINIGQNN